MKPLNTLSSAPLAVQVTPNAKASQILGWQEDGSLKMKLAAKPVDGEANAALIAFLAKTLGVPKSAITLTHGTTGRHKRLSIAGVSAEELSSRLPPK